MLNVTSSIMDIIRDYKMGGILTEMDSTWLGSKVGFVMLRRVFNSLISDGAVWSGA